MAGLAAAARDMALKDTKADEEHCRVIEADLKTLRDKQAARARQLEAQEEEQKS